ncbi:MAG: HAMP domain-containing histidine kinase [Bacteroidales bacterium]|nr:HAMP domain-containing histidine kinase [Bacteroidales bacterium]
MVDDTLLWARAQSGRITFNPENINLSKLCDEIISQLILEQEAKKISVKCLFAQDLMVYADSFMLLIILRNLLGNAIKFSNTSDIIIISAETDRTGVTIAVTDNGVGINPEGIKKLFDITQVYSTKGTANEKGTGLGLIICKDFVKMHKGKIWVESEKLIGSTFKFYLPFKQSQ